jgi:16S rRNA (uracil1498-N3)-methyltransferase
MYRFFLPPESQPTGGLVTVFGSDALHIGYALRMKPGEELVFTREGLDYRAVITAIERDSVTAKILETTPVNSEPALTLTLFQAMPKSEKMELIIQKCTELGIYRIVPFISERCVAKPKSPSAKTERFRKIAEAAAKQSGRGVIPEVTDIIPFREVIDSIKSFDTVFFCNENGGKRIRVPKSIKSAALIVGAEGGFSANEIKAVTAAGAQNVTLGRRILRCETAPIAATAIIMYAAGEI